MMFYVETVTTTPTILEIERSAVFEQSMIAAGFFVVRYDNLGVGNRTYESSLSWVEHTSKWWNIVKEQGLCHRTLEFLIDVPPNPYGGHLLKDLGRFFMQKKYRLAAEQLSEYPHAIEPKPAVAIVPDVIINSDGKVYNETFLFVGKQGCEKSKPQFKFRPASQKYKRVVTIAEFWGYGYFHFMHENLIRLPLVFSILDQYSDMKIHSHQGKSFILKLLFMFDIKRDRIVSGHVHADMAFIPEQINCGRPPANLLLLLQKSILQTNTFLLQHTSHQSKRQILIVKRERTRELRNHNEILAKVKESFSNYNVVVHTGHELMEKQFALFRSSDVIIAPHGAGLSNIVVCRKHTLIFELLNQIPHPVLCYAGLALKLKLLYVGHIIPHFHHEGQITVNSNDLVTVLQQLVLAKTEFDNQ